MSKASTENDKFNFSRLLSREKYNSSKQGEASFRVLYYGGAAGSVPFLWESQPGTPKHTFNDDPLPPLTPPPSYQSSPRPGPLQKKNSRFFNSIFARAPSRKISASRSFSSPPPSSSSSSSSCSLPSTPVNARRGGRIKARSRSTTAVYFGVHDEDEYHDESGKRSPTSTLCFGPKNESSLRRFKGYSYPIKSVKKVVSSIVGGHGTNN
ncbi:hypothetical protein Salat_1114800 [Sesamum alatum]|uniref:Uncharacterized protein n=1 Tax=Sesamum alatum TaxID=300844 RepID=A0AAE1YNK8_9LAMI|nr:hypothetical protein Salat_1114800 [Sesamum alatum]